MSGSQHMRHSLRGSGWNSKAPDGGPTEPRFFDGSGEGLPVAADSEADGFLSSCTVRQKVWPIENSKCSGVLVARLGRDAKSSYVFIAECLATDWLTFHFATQKLKKS